MNRTRAWTRASIIWPNSCQKALPQSDWMLSAILGSLVRVLRQLDLQREMPVHSNINILAQARTDVALQFVSVAFRPPPS